MFVHAIEKVLQFTRPLHNISRSMNGLVYPGTATFFFVNDNGMAITCKHVAEMIVNAEKMQDQFFRFKTERNQLPKDARYKKLVQGLELKYHYTKDGMVQLKNNFVNSFDKIDQILVHAHATLDLAILEFKGFNQKFYREHAIFLKDEEKIKAGRSLCRIGFPFPEFNNFRYNEHNDDIEWTQTGQSASPSFPIDGIITRLIADTNESNVTGIELSTPGLRGQSGGPLFDTAGIVYGMQSATKHLHLGFDMRDKEIISNGKKNKISNYPFLHAGVCVHVKKIKEFLYEHRVPFTEG